jgi:hypothetical protein
MRFAGLVLAGAALALAGCDNGAPSPNMKKIVVGDSAYVNKLRTLSQQNRDLALRRAIQDDGQQCKRIRSSREIGDFKGMSMWTARCEGGIGKVKRDLDWAIFIAPTGDVQVRSCSHVAQLGLPACEPGAASAPAAVRP